MTRCSACGNFTSRPSQNRISPNAMNSLSRSFRIHIDEGPFLLGGIADPPNIVIASNQFHNVPTSEDIPLGGWLGPWVLGMPGAMTYPEVYFIAE